MSGSRSGARIAPALALAAGLWLTPQAASAAPPPPPYPDWAVGNLIQACGAYVPQFAHAWRGFRYAFTSGGALQVDRRYSETEVRHSIVRYVVVHALQKNADELKAQVARNRQLVRDQRPADGYSPGYTEFTLCIQMKSLEQLQQVPPSQLTAGRYTTKTRR